jgi:6-pyruvoyltetrahydropterin/6-carboxytetrahydropterin synthase
VGYKTKQRRSLNQPRVVLGGILVTYISTKTFGHDIGLSAAFRQWRAKDSHCRFIHGYALSIRLEFEADELDEKNWVVDFGGLKGFKKQLEDTFDHKLIVAADDPERGRLLHLANYDLADIIVLPATGCEAFAKHVFFMARNWLREQSYAPRVRILSVEVCEHGANSAIYR